STPLNSFPIRRAFRARMLPCITRGGAPPRPSMRTATTPEVHRPRKFLCEARLSWCAIKSPAVKRRVFNGLAALSLVLCLATAGLWVRSQYISDSIDIHAGRYFSWFGTWRSYLGIDVGCFTRVPTARDLGRPPEFFYWESTPATSTT